MQVNGTYMKINAVAQLSGEKALVQQVETITGQKIDHVAQIKFNGLKDVVDALGGVDLCYDQTVNDALSDPRTGPRDATRPMGRPPWRSRACATPTRRCDSGRAERQRQVIGAIAKKAMSGKTLTNIPKLDKKTLKAALASITVDSKTNPYTLAQMVFAFRDATSDNGISGSVYWTNPGYNVSGVGSSVLLDDAKNLELFRELASGSHKPGAVGTLANQ